MSDIQYDRNMYSTNSTALDTTACIWNHLELVCAEVSKGVEKE